MYTELDTFGKGQLGPAIHLADTMARLACKMGKSTEADMLYVVATPGPDTPYRIIATDQDPTADGDIVFWPTDYEDERFTP
jgi:hypothetical protein